MEEVILGVPYKCSPLLPNTPNWNPVKGDIIVHPSSHSCLRAWPFCPLSSLIYSSGSNQ